MVVSVALGGETKVLRAGGRGARWRCATAGAGAMVGRRDDGRIQPVAVSKRWLALVRDGHVKAGRADAQPRGACLCSSGRTLALSPKS